MNAFPYTGAGSEGMTLRDYFAAKAMQAMIQNSASLNNDSDYSFDTAIVCGVTTEVNLTDSERNIQYTWAQFYAEEAYCIADAMMKARDETP